MQDNCIENSQCRLESVEIDDFTFDYSPCLHIKNFRVAETYGDKVKLFKDEIRKYFKNAL